LSYHTASTAAAATVFIHVSSGAATAASNN
jgi:hypothetical protein